MFMATTTGMLRIAAWTRIEIVKLCQGFISSPDENSSRRQRGCRPPCRCQTAGCVKPSRTMCPCNRVRPTNAGIQQEPHHTGMDTSFELHQGGPAPHHTGKLQYQKLLSGKKKSLELEALRIAPWFAWSFSSSSGVSAHGFSHKHQAGFLTHGSSYSPNLPVSLQQNSGFHGFRPRSQRRDHSRITRDSLLN